MARRKKITRVMRAFDARFPICVKLGDAKWSVHIMRRHHGLTIYDNGIVLSSKRIHSLEFLDTVIHEALHALDSSLSEDDVSRMSRGIAILLWRIGYRLL